MLAREGISSHDFGSIWFMLDQRLGIRHTPINSQSLSWADLRRYNVLVVPSGRWPADSAESIHQWVKAGGTLIAIARSASSVADEDGGIGKVRRLPDVLGDLDTYEAAILREWQVRQGTRPADEAVWSHEAAEELAYPWEGVGDAKRPDEEELKRRDAWQRLFMPPGAILAGRTDEKHWLTFGCGEVLPLLVGRSPILMAPVGVDAPVRLGMPVARGDGDGEESRRGGWAAVPAGQELRLRMSGLLWPEASQRLANGAWVTREGVGKGQVILFASSPTLRASTLGAERVLANAMVYGPGLGASRPVEQP
ncbi:hypothetical protein ACFL6X_06405 [Candidatus Latescibacterota bacterium]